MDEQEPGIRERATSAFLWDAAGLLAKQGVAFFVSIILARLLMPAEFGLVAMAMVFISVSQVFADVGFTSGLIQSRDNSSLTYSSIFYLNLVAGFVLFGFFWFAAPWIAAFYEEEQITLLVRCLSLNFIFSAFNQVQQAILRRNIEFKKITTRATIAHVAGGVAAIILALQGWGVYALVAQNLMAALINTLILWRVAEWAPRLEFSWAEVKKLVGFSSYVFLSQVVNRIVTQLDTLIVGKVFHATTVGFYTRASSLNSLVTSFSSSSIARVSFPLLSQLQSDPVRFQRTYLTMIELIAFASFGLSGSLVFAGPDLIVILFGDVWMPSIYVFQILVLMSFTYPVGLLIVSTFLAAGKSKENFWFGNIKRVISLLPLPVALVWGFEPFLYSVVAAAYLNWILNNWFVMLSFKISLTSQSKPILPYLLMFVSIGLAMHYAVKYLAIGFPFIGLVEAVIFLLIYFGLNLMLRTQGYIFFIEYTSPVWRRLKEKLGRK